MNETLNQKPPNHNEKPLPKSWVVENTIRELDGDEEMLKKYLRKAIESNNPQIVDEPIILLEKAVVLFMKDRYLTNPNDQNLAVLIEQAVREKLKTFFHYLGGKVEKMFPSEAKKREKGYLPKKRFDHSIPDQKRRAAGE